MKILFKHITVFTFIFINACQAQKSKAIQKDIEHITKEFNGKVGIAVLNLSTNETIEINAEIAFPMQSVYKFPLGMAVMNEVKKGNIQINQKVVLSKKDLLPNTHSPLRDKYPEGKSDITLLEILEKTVSQSDNNGCDYLFRLLGGPKTVDAFVKSLGFTNINILSLEAEMHKDSSLQYKNNATPKAMTALLAQFYRNKNDSKNANEVLWKMLTETTTAPNRIKGGLPKGTVFGHKSGWSGGDDRGFTNAINDVGIIIMPDGTPVAISVFVSDTPIKSVETDKFVARISKMVYEYFLE